MIMAKIFKSRLQQALPNSCCLRIADLVSREPAQIASIELFDDGIVGLQHSILTHGPLLFVCGIYLS